jgi:hypothetical protein
MANPIGEADSEALRLDFDRRLMLQFRGRVITSDGGLLVYRELDDALGLTDTGADTLADARTGKNGRHLLVGLLRQWVFGRLAGYEDVNDAEQLWPDPAMRWVVGGRAIQGVAASASQMGRFETEWLTRPENLAALADLPGRWIDKVHTRRPSRIIVLDMDSSESPTYGEQEGSAYNGHFGCMCYHPLFVFNQLGDVERCALRSGNVHSADGWREVLEQVVSRYRGKGTRLYFRGDSAVANPEIYEFLEVEGMGYAIRLPASRVLQEKIGYLLKRPVGRPPREVRRYYASCGYLAQSQGCQPRSLRDVPHGRGRCTATDVPRDPDVHWGHRLTRRRGRTDQMGQGTTARVRPDAQLEQRISALRAQPTTRFNCLFSAASAIGCCPSRSKGAS